jgi:hypothetical protein
LETNWRKLNKELALMNEEQVLALLNEERSNRKRLSFLQRLHQRYTTLRAARERLEILKGARDL